MAANPRLPRNIFGGKYNFTDMSRNETKKQKNKINKSKSLFFFLFSKAKRNIFDKACQ